MKSIRFLPPLLLLLLSGCASPPPPAIRVEMPPSAPKSSEMPSEEIPEASHAIRYQIDGQFVTLDELKTGEFDKESTVMIVAEPSVTFSRISEAMREVYSLGFLVGFVAQEAGTP